jgi:hypothetical protein
MTKQRPIQKDGFDRNRERLLRPSPMHSIDALFKLECEVILAYYYGGYVRAGWHLFWHGAASALRGCYWNAVFRFCDLIGWTRLQQIPGTPYFERHSGKCDKLNCQDIECVDRGIPNWYKKLTKMNRQ